MTNNSDQTESKAANPGQNPEQDRNTTLRELGQKLKDIREAQHMEIAEISDATKIQKKYIAAIEDGNIDLLPKGPYKRSFIHQYCEYLNAGDMWKNYDAVTGDLRVCVPIDNNAHREENGDVDYSTRRIFKTRSYIWIYAIVVISLAAAGWITWNYRGSVSAPPTNPVSGGTAPISAQRAQQSEPVSADAKSVDLSWMDGKAPAAPQSVAAVSSAPVSQSVPPAANTGELRLSASGTVWLKVTLGRKDLFKGIMKTDEEQSYQVSGDIPLRVRYGNPGKINVAWNGADTGPASTGRSPVTRYYWPDGTVSKSREKPAPEM